MSVTERPERVVRYQNALLLDAVRRNLESWHKPGTIYGVSFVFAATPEDTTHQQRENRTIFVKDTLTEARGDELTFKEFRSWDRARSPGEGCASKSVRDDDPRCLRPVPLPTQDKEVRVSHQLTNQSSPLI